MTSSGPGRKTYLIDAYNVLHKIPELARILSQQPEYARRTLAERVQDWAAGSKAGVVLVFDGRGEEMPSGGLRVVFSGSESADRYIRRALERTVNPRSAVVVSSDLEVAAHARACEAEVMKSETFLERLDTREEEAEEDMKNRKLTPSEVNYWRRLFESEGPAE